MDGLMISVFSGRYSVFLIQKFTLTQVDNLQRQHQSVRRLNLENSYAV